MSREAMKLALDALVFAAYEDIEYDDACDQKVREARNALRQALETEQEPVAWRTFDGEGGYDYRSYEMNENYDKEWAERNPNHAHWVEPLYTSPQKQWVGLTDQEVMVAAYQAGFDIHEDYENEDDPEAMHWWTPDGEACDDSLLKLRDLIEAKLKERNHG